MSTGFRSAKGVRRAMTVALATLTLLAWIATVPGAKADTPTLSPLVKVSGPTPFSQGCSGAPPQITIFVNAEVEPQVAVDPKDPDHIVGVWQQDRFLGGAAQGLLTGTSFDGGATWQLSYAPLSVCSGGNSANGANFRRASDPWVTFAPNGDVYQSSISLTPATGSNAVLVSKSVDGGLTWGDPVALIRDNSFALKFNDKESITADPTDANRVYAVWDRLDFPSDGANPNALHSFSFRGDTMFSRTTDGGLTWSPARAIFAPQRLLFSIGNIIVVLPDGDLVDVMALGQGSQRQRSAWDMAVIRSEDRGDTWSDPIVIAHSETNFVMDPETGIPIRAGDFLPEAAVDPVTGALYVVWEDASFNAPPLALALPSIALSRSTDGGFTWSPPMRINQELHVAAFTPSIAVASDGTVGVTYYDFRSNTADPFTLPTDYWFVHCHADCMTPEHWAETHVAGPFDMRTAPFSGGLFLGDYEGLVAVGKSFLAFFVQTNSGNVANPTDVFAVRLQRP